MASRENSIRRRSNRHRSPNVHLSAESQSDSENEPSSTSFHDKSTSFNSEVSSTSPEVNRSRSTVRTPPKTFKDTPVKTTPKSVPLQNDKNGQTLIFVFIMSFVGAVALCGGFTIYYAFGDSTDNSLTIRELRERFPNEFPDFWSFVQSGVQDVMNLNRPATFLFLYTKRNEARAQKLIKLISKYVLCRLNSCNINPITLTPRHFQKVSDYGDIIANYGPKLEERTLMLVQNIEKIQGEKAQALHSFCDEYSPLVRRAVIILTMEVSEIHEDFVGYVEKELRRLWFELKDDIYYPLFTRISSIILPIVEQ